MQQQHQRAYVWFNSDLRKDPTIQGLSLAAFGLWTRLPLVVSVDAYGNHLLPRLPEIPSTPRYQVANLMRELIDAGLAIYLGHGAYHMTVLSRRYYSFEEPEDE